MLTRFNKLVNLILEDKNIYTSADEIINAIFHGEEYYNEFNIFKNDNELINRIRASDKEIIKEACDKIYTDIIEKLDENKKSDKEKYHFADQIFNFLKELC